MGNKVLPFTRDRAGQTPTEDASEAALQLVLDKVLPGARP